MNVTEIAVKFVVEAFKDALKDAEEALKDPAVLIELGLAALDLVTNDKGQINPKTRQKLQLRILRLKRKLAIP